MKRSLITEYQGHFGPFFQKEAQRSADMFDQAVVVDGIPRWTTNNRIPPTDLLELWAYLGKQFDFDTTIAHSEAESMKALDEYRERMKNYQPSDEERFEMQAAFGNGATVVDAITGRKIQL